MDFVAVVVVVVVFFFFLNPSADKQLLRPGMQETVLSSQ